MNEKHLLFYFPLSKNFLALLLSLAPYLADDLASDTDPYSI